MVRLSRKNGWGKKGGGEKEKNFSPAEPAKSLKNKILNNKSQKFPPKFRFREIPHFLKICGDLENLATKNWFMNSTLFVELCPHTNLFARLKHSLIR